MVSAPVRIADAATVRLLRPGDRVDVIAAANSPAGEASEARVVASGARVTDVPRAMEAVGDGGALVVLTVPRATAAALAGASTTSRLAVTVC
jgi:Flp pilus assembly protein CpaB